MRRAVRSLEMRLGLAGFYLRRTRGAVVLAYHGVAPTDEIVDPWVQSVHITPDALRRQLEFVASRFDVVDCLNGDALSRSRRDRPLALITFDDGYRNFITHALPVLKAAGIPGTVFVTANCIENRTRHPVYRCKAAIASLAPGSYDFDSLGEQVSVTEANRAEVGRRLAERVKRMRWEDTTKLLAELRSMVTEDETKAIDEKYSTDAPMSWDDVRAAQREGVQVGSHTLDHVILGREQSPGVINTQVRESRRLITERIGECRSFAYPNGTVDDVSSVAVNAVRDAGYEQAFTTVPGVVRSEDMDETRLLLPRLTVGPDWNGFRKYVSTAWRHNGRHRAMVSAITAQPASPSDSQELSGP